MGKYEKIWGNMGNTRKYGIIQGKYGKYEEKMRFEGNIGK
jgi:hypothetical protein